MMERSFSTTHSSGRRTVRCLIGKSGQFGLGVLLVAIAGYVDAIGYIALGGFFASFMSGASISLGVGISEGDWAALYQAVFVIGAFLAAAVVATVMAEVTDTWALATVLLLEAGLLGGAVWLTASGWPSSVAILPIVAAMGVQNTALRPINGVRLGVTYMTGTLVSLGQGLGGALVGRGRVRNWSPHALLWCVFCAGAAVGSSLYIAFGFIAVSGPAALVAASGIIVSIMAYFKKHQRTPDGSDDLTQ